MSERRIKPEEIFDMVVRMGALSADGPVIAAANATGAERTRIAVSAALLGLEENGIIRIVPPREWPPTYRLGRTP